MADGDLTTIVHEALAQKSLLPSKHLVDTGYVDGPLLAASRLDYGVELLGPTRADYHWQAREQKGFAASVRLNGLRNLFQPGTLHANKAATPHADDSSGRAVRRTARST